MCHTILVQGQGRIVHLDQDWAKRVRWAEQPRTVCELHSVEDPLDIQLGYIALAKSSSVIATMCVSS